MGPQSRESPNFKNFGKVVASPSLGPSESCESVFAHGSSTHQKCYNYAQINLLFGLCRFVWIIDPFVIHPSSHLEAPTRLSTPKVMRTKERTPTPYPLVIFILNSQLSLSKNLGCINKCMYIPWFSLFMCCWILRGSCWHLFVKTCWASCKTL
jgi:hypothetical protein